jgi:3-deoxy-D-manno-octulosonic acid kinase
MPPGYTALAIGTRRALVRDDLVAALGAWLLATPLGPPRGATPIDGGRGAAFRIALADASGAVVRLGRRGGAVAHLVRDRYVGVRPRPWREVAVSWAARERGAPVPEVLAACVHGWGAYRSAVVTAEIPHVRPLLAALRGAAPGEPRQAIAAAAAAAVARLHRAGVGHPDLNLGNVVVGDAGAAVVDLDRARIRPGVLAGPARARSLARLARSARKLDPSGATIDTATTRAFHDAYRRALEDACAS